jgi:hypothetical protein
MMIRGRVREEFKEWEIKHERKRLINEININ